MIRPPIATPARRHATLTRRAAGALLALAPIAACGRARETDAQRVSADRLLGDPDAPVTVIEYASVTCPNCKAFHDLVFPEIKARYIDTGQVCFVFREMPTAPPALAMGGFLMARCAPEESYFDVLDTLFERQRDLVRAYQIGTARDELARIARPLGMTDAELDDCLRDTEQIERIQQVAEDGRDNHGVTGTPMFVINGRTYSNMGIEQFATILDQAIAEG